MSSNSLQLIRVFARYEPTRDPIAISNLRPAELARATDVAIYQDAAATRCIARFGCDRKRPSLRTKIITLNCWKWSVAWLPGPLEVGGAAIKNNGRRGTDHAK